MIEWIQEVNICKAFKIYVAYKGHYVDICLKKENTSHMSFDGFCGWTLNLPLNFLAIKEKGKYGRVHNLHYLIKMSLLILKESQESTWHENLKGIDHKGH